MANKPTKKTAAKKVIKKTKPASKKAGKVNLTAKDAKQIGNAIVKGMKAAQPKPAKNTDIIVTSPVDPDVRIVMASELADDELIEKELMGEVLPYYIYQFPQDGKVVTGLSTKGVNETVRRLNRDKKSGYNIRINPQHIQIERDVEEDGQKGVSVTVYAENLIDGNSAWGTKFEAYIKPKKGGGTYKNTFCVEKALSKAERNAKRKLIPEPIIIKMIQQLIAADPNSVKQLAPAATQTNIAHAAPVMPSDVEEVKNVIRTAIQNAKTVDVLMQIDSQTKASTKFDAKFKEEVRELAANKIDEINKAK